MIKSITVKNHLNNSIKLELMRPELSGFIIRSIDGLGPAKANINTSEYATTHGGYFNSAHIGQRNITMDLEFFQTDTESIEDIRQKSYKYFPEGNKVCLTIETDNRELETEGWVESNEPDIFSPNESCNISIICPDPFFYSTSMDETIFYGVEPLFEFPFENDSLTEPLLEMGAIQNKTEQVVLYDGDAEVGISIYIHAVGEVTSDVIIANTGTKQTMTINTDKLEKMTGSAIIAGDNITINTQKNNKNITLLRDGKTYNILNCLEKGSVWFTLVKGANIFAYDAETESINLQFHIANKIAYYGV